MISDIRSGMQGDRKKMVQVLSGRKGVEMKSIISNERECFVCGKKEWVEPLHKHHILGSYNRKRSDRDGLWVYLCPEHHNMSSMGVHFNRPFEITLKKLAQTIWERENEGGRDEFIKRYGKSYL